MSKQTIKGFYRFLCRKIRTQIGNKERMGYRGPKRRYAVWRAEYNQKWKKVDKECVERICRENGLDADDYLDVHQNNPWDHAYRILKKEGFSIRRGPTKAE